MKPFFLLYKDTYRLAFGHKVIVPGFKHLSLFAFNTKAGSRKCWHITEGWTGYDVTPFGKNFFTKKALLDECARSFKAYEDNGKSFDTAIRRTLENGYMSPDAIKVEVSV